MTQSTAIVQGRYTTEDPGPWCPNHRSVYCSDVQAWIESRNDTELLAEAIGSNIGQGFTVALPIYPKFCIWERISYDGVNHELLGPMAEMTGRGHVRHKIVARLLPGEGAADLAASLREQYEAEIEDDIASLRSARRAVGRPVDLPRCSNSMHGIKYQRLLTEMTDPKLLADEWDAVSESVYALMWTYHYYQTCLFCWTKSTLPDAIRVAPDFAVEPPAQPTDNSDLIPDASDTNRRSSTPPW